MMRKSTAFQSVSTIQLMGLVFLLFLNSCRSPKVLLDAEVNQEVVFGNGQWILVDPIYDKNWNHFEDLYVEGFTSLIGDSLHTMNQVRQTHLLAEELTFDQSERSLEELGAVLKEFDYLIMCKALTVAEEASSISSHEIGQGASVFHNEVKVGIAIYDLKGQLLISKITGTGTSHDVSSPGDSWRLMDTPDVIAHKTLQKILEHYGFR
nr:MULTISPECIES: hypothetical protein [unclassified Allomuricauda]|tara:strand:+ start:2431 stop:3054 length:624 start_codon:yes stop_codon:yes gene_type:complete